MEAIIDYGFNSLNVKKLKLEVLNDNIKAIKLYKRFNFKVTNQNSKYVIYGTKK